VHNRVQLSATLGTIVQWELKIALWLNIYVTWDMIAPLDRLIKQNANLDIINQPKVKVSVLFVQQENIVMVQTPQLPLPAQRDSIALQAQSIPTNIHALQASTILPREKEL
jgi:sugar-specific transcriptional regulator TrmB